MSADLSTRRAVPLRFSASVVLEQLAVVACALGAFILPEQYPQEGRAWVPVLWIAAGLLQLVTIANLVAGDYVTRLLYPLGIRTRVELPREGLAYLGIMVVLAVGALLGRSNMLLLVFGMMAGPFILNGWIVHVMLRKVTATRLLPRSAIAGEFFTATVEVRNSKRIFSSRMVEVTDTVHGRRMKEQTSVMFVRIPPKASRIGSYQMMIPIRGRFRFESLRLNSRFPLGIGERVHRVSQSQELLVHPAIGRLKPEWRRRARSLSESLNRSRPQLGVFDDEFHQIREYRAGDNPRAVHWRSSARHGQLMIRQFEQKRDSEVTVLLDGFRPADVSEDLMEDAISLAATICVEQTRQTIAGQYRLMSAGRELSAVECAGASRFRQAALDALAEFESSPKADLASLLSQAFALSHNAAGATILLTARPAAARLIADCLAEEQLSRHQHSAAHNLMILEISAREIGALLEFSDRHSAPPAADTSPAVSAVPDTLPRVSR